jgi:hypothetical protein
MTRLLHLPEAMVTRQQLGHGRLPVLVGQLLVFPSDDETNLFKFLLLIITGISGQNLTPCGPQPIRTLDGRRAGAVHIGLSGTFILDLACAKSIVYQRFLHSSFDLQFFG